MACRAQNAAIRDAGDGTCALVLRAVNEEFEGSAYTSARLKTLKHPTGGAIQPPKTADGAWVDGGRVRVQVLFGPCKSDSDAHQRISECCMQLGGPMLQCAATCRMSECALATVCTHVAAHFYRAYACRRQCSCQQGQ